MINNLTVTSPFLSTSSYSGPHIGSYGQSAGQMRYNTSLQQVEVYDGSAWIMLSQNVSVGLSYEAAEVLRWATEKMQEEAELKQRMERHPGLKDAWEKFQIMDILSKEDGNPA